jgi:hypothetical protein
MEADPMTLALSAALPLLALAPFARAPRWTAARSSARPGEAHA